MDSLQEDSHMDSLQEDYTWILYMTSVNSLRRNRKALQNLNQSEHCPLECLLKRRSQMTIVSVIVMTMYHCYRIYRFKNTLQYLLG